MMIAHHTYGVITQENNAETPAETNFDLVYFSDRATDRFSYVLDCHQTQQKGTTKPIMDLKL